MFGWMKGGSIERYDDQSALDGMIHMTDKFFLVVAHIHDSVRRTLWGGSTLSRTNVLLRFDQIFEAGGTYHG
jgi:hypothetical protein